MQTSFFVDLDHLPIRVLSTRDVRHFECRWPISVGDEDFSLCREPVTKGSYCPCHAVLAYRGHERTLVPVIAVENKRLGRSS